jgi:hypothetical protein
MSLCRRTESVLIAAMVMVAASTATAQPLGVFRWQMQPYCNVLRSAWRYSDSCRRDHQPSRAQWDVA